MHFRKNRYVALLLIIIFIINGSLSYAQQYKTFSFYEQNTIEINYKRIIDQGIKKIFKDKNLNNVDVDDLLKLEEWYNNYSQIEFASLVETTFTLKFVDGSYTLLMDIFSLINNSLKKYTETFDDSPHMFSQIILDSDLGQTALILNPSEYLYGNRHCKKIINTLLGKGYNIVYLANKDVDLSYIEYNLESEIIYINTHAGYWDIDGDSQSDAVVIATGEYWTNQTKERYQFEYENQMIVEGMVGDTSFIAFTPLLIDHFYGSSEFPGTLVYMATCYATYDDSMANAFLNSGARTYMGWTRNTIFWINSFTSILTFRLLSRGFTVRQVCRFIRSGGVINRLLGSKLTCYGDGKYRLLK